MRSIPAVIRSVVLPCAFSLVLLAPVYAGETGSRSPGDPVVREDAGIAAGTLAGAAPEESATREIGNPLTNEALESLRGGESLPGIEVRNDGRVDGNTADGIVSGSNIVGDGAFSNASGISTVIQNSGSNVLIQNGTAVNVQFVDPGR